MNKTIVKPGQTFFDLAIEHLGSAAAAYRLAALNSMSLTDALAAGQEIDLPEEEDRRTRQFFNSRINKPAANIDPVIKDGIGVWVIGQFTIPQSDG